MIRTILLLLSITYCPLLFAGGASYRVEENGVIVYPDPNFSGNTRAVKLQVISEKIIRVIASPEIKFPDVTSLISVYQNVKSKFTVTKKADKVILKTPSVTASVL